MSLNKVQLIGNVGKDPDVRYLDNGVAGQHSPWLRQTVLIHWRTVHKFRSVQNGTILSCGVVLPKQQKNMFIKVTNCILKEKSVLVLMMTRTESSVIL